MTFAAPFPRSLAWSAAALVGLVVLALTAAMAESSGVVPPTRSVRSAWLPAAARGTPPDSSPGNVAVAVPIGTLAITTSYTASTPLDLGSALAGDASPAWSASATFGSETDLVTAIKIVDTRAGELGFVANVQSSDFVSGSGPNESFSAAHAGLVGVTAHQVSGNALQAADIVTADTLPNEPGLVGAQTFASYPSGRSLGTAWLSGTFEIDGVATSIVPGVYTATVTVTAF